MNTSKILLVANFCWFKNYSQRCKALKNYFLFLNYCFEFSRSLTQTDSVRFNNLVTSLRSTEYAHRSSGWVLMDSAETLFVTAEKRLYNSKHGILYGFIFCPVFYFHFCMIKLIFYSFQMWIRNLIRNGKLLMKY